MDKNHLTFEDYLSLFRDKDITKWNNNKIIQVLDISGLGGHHKLNRKDLADCLNSVNLIPPTRSTINLNNGPVRLRHVPPPSLHELKNDIEELGWQECPIGSTVTIHPAAILVKNKNKTVRKNKRIIKQVKSAESLVEDANIANRDDVEMTSPVKKQKMKKKTVTVRVEAAMLNDADQFNWTQTHCQNEVNPRTYFKCKNWKQGCPAKRHVQPDPVDPLILIVTYYNGEHKCLDLL